MNAGVVTLAIVMKRVVCVQVSWHLRVKRAASG